MQLVEYERNVLGNEAENHVLLQNDYAVARS